MLIDQIDQNRDYHLRVSLDAWNSEYLFVDIQNSVSLKKLEKNGPQRRKANRD